MTRARKAEKSYSKSPKGRKCPFCNPDKKVIVKKLTYFTIIKNIYGYSLWDSSEVTDHLLLVPNKHMDNMEKFTDEAKLEYIHTIIDYESHGYSVYSRGHNSHMKTVSHQHTHLLKLTPKRIKWLFFLQKPYLRFYK